MNRLTKIAAMLVSGMGMANEARADYTLFPQKTPAQPCVSPASAKPVKVTQTAPPPLAMPATVQASAASLSSSTAPAPAELPWNVATDPNSDIAGKGSQSPRVYRINYKTFILDYDIKEYGPSGTAGVEIWYTRDGRSWQQYDGVQRENPCWISLEEGVYGITLVAKTGFGGGQKPPVPGDQPQLWVQVDLTKPVVSFTDIQQTEGSRILSLNWTAKDNDFGRKPINLYFAERSEGPWVPIAEDLENTGSYTWQIPPGTPSIFLVRVEATDLAGNVGSFDSPKPVKVDLAKPRVTNIRLGPPQGK